MPKSKSNSPYYSKSPKLLKEGEDMDNNVELLDVKPDISAHNMGLPFEMMGLPEAVNALEQGNNPLTLASAPTTLSVLEQAVYGLIEKIDVKFNELTRKVNRIEQRQGQMLMLLKSLEDRKEHLQNAHINFILMKSIFPLRTIDKMVELEMMLMHEEKYSEIYCRFLAAKYNLETIFKELFTDDLLIQFNFSGKNGKNALKAYTFVSRLIYTSVFSQKTDKEFEKAVALQVSKSHNRYHCKLARCKNKLKGKD